MEATLRERIAAQQPGGPIAVLPVSLCQMIEHALHPLEADRLGPGKRSARVVDAQPHRLIDRLGVRDAGVNGLGRLVRERGSASAFGRALASTLSDAAALRKLEQGALTVAARMTLDAHLQKLDTAFAVARA